VFGVVVLAFGVRWPLLVASHSAQRHLKAKFKIQSDLRALCASVVKSPAPFTVRRSLFTVHRVRGRGFGVWRSLAAAGGVILRSTSREVKF